ncbi:MAG TPA: ribosome-binding factor A [Candidatus Paceibacterota bacterium]|nr:ribosome-binding factor A [Candidatus Paceibacterota bacterium]
MHQDRTHALEERIKEILAPYIERESNRSALLTITRVTLSDRGKKALLYLSVLPETAEKDALGFLKRKRSTMRELLMEHLRIATIPFVDVTIDTGAKALHTIETLLRGA